MNLYNDEELSRISKIKETNDKLEDFFNLKREEWTNNINPLFDVIKNNFNLENSSKIMDCQSLALTYRQMINEQISFFLNKRSKEEVKIKKLKQDKFVFNNFIEGTKVPHEGVVVKHISGDRKKIGKIINPDYLIFSEKHNVGDSH